MTKHGQAVSTAEAMAASEAYGRLKEGAHLTDYTCARACSSLEWLLEEERWRALGFDDVGAFLETVQLGAFRQTAETRKRIGALIKRQTEASNRQIARVLGVHHVTVDRALGANAPAGGRAAKGTKGAAGANAPPDLSGEDAARAVEQVQRREQLHQERAETRDRRERELGQRLSALPNKRYGVILADPEWKFETYSPKGKTDTSAENHYPTSDLEVIKARDVPSISADDAVLFLWSTVPMQPQAYEVMAAWGFKYVSQIAWNKDRTGTGYWTLNKHEVLLIGKRGNIPAPTPGTQPRSVIDAPVGKHSEKPEVFYEIIEKVFPTLPKVELNARKARDGWDAWGLEAPEGFLAAAE